VGRKSLLAVASKEVMAISRGGDSSGEVGGRSRDRGERDRDEREASTRTICRSSSSVSSAILASRDEIRGFPGRARDEI